MRAHTRGIGFVLGLALTVFGSAAAWADSATNEATNVTVNETVNQTTPFPADPGNPDIQVFPLLRAAPETGDGGQDADGEQDLSVSMLAIGMALGAAAGVGAIIWREVRR